MPARALDQAVSLASSRGEAALSGVLVNLTYAVLAGMTTSDIYRCIGCPNLEAPAPGTLKASEDLTNNTEKHLSATLEKAVVVD
jgi:hypothetical protein